MAIGRILLTVNTENGFGNRRIIRALEIQGLSHYLSFSENKIVHLYGNDPLPEWVANLDLNTTFVKHTTSNLLGKNLQENKQSHSFILLRDWTTESKKLILSSPE